MIITNCPRCGAMNATTTCNKCGWSQFNKSTVSTGARVVEWEEEMSESAEMECKRCGDNEDRIDGFCSKECKDKYSLEEALSKMNIRIAELEDQLEDWTNNGWAEDYKARIAELEAIVDKLIEAGDSLSDDREYQDDLVDIWHDVTRDWKEG